MKELLQQAIDKFNERIRTDDKLQQELKDMNRSVQIDLGNGEPSYYFMIEGNGVSDLVEGETSDPDIRIISDPETLRGLMNREIGVMKAWATKKLQVKGNLEDILRIRKFLTIQA